MCHEQAVDLPCEDRSGPAARRCVRDLLAGWGVGPRDAAASAVEDAVLVTSELVGNALRFCRDSDITLRLLTHHDRIDISVYDHERGVPEVLRVGAGSERGRGLAIVEALCAEWGFEPLAVGKRVWGRVAVPPRSGLAAGCTLAP